ncbi:MAG: hypothetical protein ABI967_06455 [bacterium]
MSNFQTERSSAGKPCSAVTRLLCQSLTLLLIGALVFAALPRITAQAQTRQSDQSLNSLIGLLSEAESLAKVEIVRSELQEIREAANRASRVDPNNPAIEKELQHIRTMLRRIIDDPRGESTEFQEKIANSLKLVQDYMSMGDVNGLRVRTETAFGLTTTSFDTLEGTVSVNLPDDIAAGDTISGTVIAEPKGSTKDEQAKNEDSLNGYVVEVAKQETPRQQTPGSKWSIPPATQFVPVVLKTRQGKEVARSNVPIHQGNTYKPKTGQSPNGVGSYLTPQFGQAGRPVSVAGPFDGDFNNTWIKLEDQTAQFLAESPRKVVVKSPANLVGRATIVVNEQNHVVAKCSYQSLGIRLAADKLNLIRGEQTMLSATISGLNGVTSPVSMQLTNASPWTVRMEGGETQTITVQPEEIAGGSFTAKRSLTGVKAGGFTINAVVNSNGPQGLMKPCEGGAPASGPISGLGRGDRTISNPGSAGPAENAAVKTGQHVLSEKDALKEVQLIDEPSGVSTGVLPDLTIKDMCLAEAPATPSETLRVLIANIGDRDADPFELGIKYIIYSDESGFWDVDKLAGLKTGEEKWLEYRPMSGSGFTLAFVVDRAFKFQAIADPSYRQGTGPLGIYVRDVKSKIVESNKGNNTLTISRADMRRCDAKIAIPRPALPAAKPVNPVRP